MNISLFLYQAALILPAFLIALSFHEFAHAFTATLLGDDTPRRHGRLTLNPLAHIDPFGLLFLLVFRIGWAKPVVFDQRNFKHPRAYTIMTALAGPFSNFVLALASFYVIAYFPTSLFSHTATISVLQILEAVAYVNIMLGVFNAMPIPPLDGSHIMTAMLMKRYPYVVAWMYRYSIFILLGIFIFPQTKTILGNMIAFAEVLIKKLVF